MPPPPNLYRDRVFCTLSCDVYLVFFYEVNMSHLKTQSVPAPKEQKSHFVVKAVKKAQIQGGAIRWSTSAGRGI